MSTVKFLTSENINAELNRSANRKEVKSMSHDYIEDDDYMFITEITPELIDIIISVLKEEADEE